MGRRRKKKFKKAQCYQGRGEEVLSVLGWVDIHMQQEIYGHQSSYWRAVLLPWDGVGQRRDSGWEGCGVGWGNILSFGLSTEDNIRGQVTDGALVMKEMGLPSIKSAIATASTWLAVVDVLYKRHIGEGPDTDQEEESREDEEAKDLWEEEVELSDYYLIVVQKVQK